MKRFLAISLLLVLAGFGCAPASPSESPSDSNATAYQNDQYGLSFEYPSNMEAHSREDANRQAKYLGLDADFFLSLRDTTKDTKPTNVAFFYAIPNLTLEAFQTALVDSSQTGGIQVKSVEDVTVNGIAMKKITSTTEVGTDKVHYLIDRNGTTVVISVFLDENDAFDPVLQTLRITN